MKDNLGKILLVEDDPGDVDLIKEALRQGRTMVELNVVEDGMKAMVYLRREAPYADAWRPDLILLDLNLPKKDGREVLREIKSDETLKDIPVVALSASKSPVDIRESYNGGVNCYVSKPVGFEELATVVRSIKNYWFRLAELPPRWLKAGGLPPLEAQEAARLQATRVAFPVSIRVQEGSSLLTVGILHDLSAGGLGAYLPRQLTPGERVTVSVDIPGRSMSLGGVVQWAEESFTAKGYRHGIRFTEMQEDSFPFQVYSFFRKHLEAAD